MKVAVIGFEVEGRSALHYWRDQGAEVTICKRSESPDIPAGTPTQIGADYLRDMDRFDLIVRSAGIQPEIILKDNPTVKPKLTTVINEFVRVCPSKNIIGITGTKGKGTTSTLTTLMLEASGHRVFLGGNIGVSPFDFLSQITPEDWVVLELSSYQLSDFNQRVPLAACLMMAPEHLTWHENLSNYVEAKKNLFTHQTAKDTAIYFADNELSHEIASTSPGKKIPYFASPGAYVEQGKIRVDNEIICDVKDLKLLGRHNWQNACAATTLAWQVTQTPDAIRGILTTFTGLPHRLEFVREHEGISYYNDSFASAPPAAAAAAEAIKGSKVLIIGGFDRELPLEDMVVGIKEQQADIRHILLVGESGERVAAELDAAGLKNYQISTAKTMDEIVKQAKALGKKGDAVVLSPGFPSFDMFKNFEERGLQFKQAVSKL